MNTNDDLRRVRQVWGHDGKSWHAEYHAVECECAKCKYAIIEDELCDAVWNSLDRTMNFNVNPPR